MLRKRLRGGAEKVGFEGNSVGRQSKDKGRMDRSCCQDLSAVTNGCCEDEASKTLENSDVVILWNVCLHLCAFYVRLSAYSGGRVVEGNRKCVRLCNKCVPSCKVPALTAALQHGRVLGN